MLCCKSFIKESSAPICIIKNWLSTRGSTLRPFTQTEADHAFEASRIFNARSSKEAGLTVGEQLRIASENFSAQEPGTDEWATANEAERQAKHQYYIATEKSADAWGDLAVYYLEVITNAEEKKLELVTSSTISSADIAFMDEFISRHNSEYEWVAITARDEEDLSIQAKIVAELCDFAGNSFASAGLSDSSIEDSIGVMGENGHLNEENLLLPQLPIGLIFSQVPVEEIGVSSDSDDSSIQTYVLGTSSYVSSNCYYDLCYGFILLIVLLRIYLVYKWFHVEG